jgi:hypothetical protein
MTTEVDDQKPVSRSTVFTADQNRKLLSLRGKLEKQTGKTWPIQEVIRQAVEEKAKRHGV